MKQDQLIFSDKIKYRVSRHILLWICFSAYFFVVNFFPRNTQDLYNIETYSDAAWKMIYIPISIYSVYTTINLLVPRLLLSGKYVYFFASFILLSIFNIWTAYLITTLLVQLTRPIPDEVYIFQSLIYGLGMGSAASGFAAIFKLYKIHYLEQKENEILQQHKISAELRVIKSGFHPHFLSNALSNISEFIQNNSKLSPVIILKLSDLLSYILYENQEEEVPLEQEMLMVKEYLDLERIFYGNRIVINLQEEGNLEGKSISPLILLTLVQNCCEQFLISLQQKLNIDVTAISGEKHFIFQLSCNGYYEYIHGVPFQNTGLSHLLRRIEITYAKQHQLDIYSENGLFHMILLIDQSALAGKIAGKPEVKSLYEPA